MSLTSLQQQIDVKLTPSSSSDKVSSEEVRYVFGLTVGEIRQMGVLQLESTAEFSITTQDDGLFAYVDGVGFFKYRATGTVDNQRVFAAPDGGFWELAAAASGGSSNGGGTIDLSGYVPTSRTVNGKPLTEDIAVTREDLDVDLIDNTPDASKPLSTPQKEYVDAVNAKVTSLQTTVSQQATTITNLTNALLAKADLVNGVVPTSQIPGTVPEILQYATKTDFPAVGQTDKLYLPLDAPTELYRWSGSVYVNASGGGAAQLLDKYFTTTDGQVEVVLAETQNKYLISVRISSDSSWQVLHGGTDPLAADQVRHDSTTGKLTFGSALPTSTNNLALYR